MKNILPDIVRDRMNSKVAVRSFNLYLEMLQYIFGVALFGVE